MRLVDADILKIKIHHRLMGRITHDDLIKWIDEQPTIDTVKCGKWEVGCAGKIRICSNCEESFDDTCNFIERDWYYCPNCGADMRGE